MVKEFSMLKDGKVVNRILCTSEFAEQYAAENGYEFTDDPKAKINAKLEGVEYVDATPQPKASASKTDRLIDLLVEKQVITSEDAATIKSGK